MRFSIVVNGVRDDALQAAKESVKWLLAQSYTVGTEHELASVIRAESFSAEELGDVDLMIAFGGDGTLLRAAHYSTIYGAPILGVYYGSFGFVTQCDPLNFYSVLERFLSGEAKIEERMMIRTELIREEKVIASLDCLNEAALHRDASGRVLTFSVSVDGEELSSYPADGILVVTPTGSTAYNLSAGGPILDPSLRAIICTGINPHTLGVRPLVLSSNSEIVLNVQSPGDTVLLGDGHYRLHLIDEDQVRVTSSPKVTRLVCTQEGDFLKKLKDRLFWSKKLS